ITDRLLQAGVDVTAVWCQDWSGKRVTSFGKRVNWNWHADEKTYPNLQAYIEGLHRRGVRFMAYVTPYLADDGDLYREGVANNAFIKTDDGGDFLIDFGEYNCGAIDLTDPQAVAWFRERILKQNMLSLGIDGWMADFGEYQPAEGIALANGMDPALAHNAWPVLWAKCNYGAVEDYGRLGDAVYFMRSGGAGTGRYCTLLWAGDQSVDFSRHDGLITVVCGALSAGVSGVSFTHSDVGGYTSLYGNVRTKELFLRWAEMAVFTPVMRTHEGNRPAENFQVYDDPDAVARYARLVRLHSGLLPYAGQLAQEAARTGLPLQRPLFFYYDEPFAYGEQFEYLYGRDLLVAPVWHEGVQEWEVRLPRDEWVHLWTGETYGGGTFTVPAPPGRIPVFYRRGSAFAPLFERLAREYRETER
ncbi:MAG: alpha-glucosidase, partial [Clostridia bacterium]|nr:alpha-glucosidase [Clostridia bacterium]